MPEDGGLLRPLESSVSLCLHLGFCPKIWVSEWPGFGYQHRMAIVAKGEAMQESTKLKWEGRWDQLKGKVQQTWGDVTDDDLDVAEGNYDELIGRIKERTGESYEEIEQRLND